MKENLDYWDLQRQVTTMTLSQLQDLLRAVESELEVRGETLPDKGADAGVFLGQGIYTVGKHIPEGTYAFHLPKNISRDAANSTYLYLFDNLEKYKEHLSQNHDRLGMISTFSVYRNSPVSCIPLTQGQILAIKYNGVIVSKFNAGL